MRCPSESFTPAPGKCGPALKDMAFSESRRISQSSVAPPTFVLFCNDAELFHFSYQRYIENCLRTAYGFAGTPIVLVIKQRGEDPDIQVRRPGKEGNNE